MTVSNLPQLPLLCLKTADSTRTQEVVRGKPTIIDFWTTRCTRCPDALDKLNNMAQDPMYENVQFVSICCDKLDGARDIIEKEDDLRWQNVNHYFMEQTDKEFAKQELGFKSVPFYVVLDEEGTITQKGNHGAIDFEDVPGIVRPVEEETKEEEKEMDDMDGLTLDFQLDFSFEPIKEPPTVERVFCLSDDF
eukprot:Nitzschia sp. Nitz4//scaffold141_size107518//80108//80762//NITZ4_004290-RA/size107518-augustus-gene-0.97-mRNA-1//-1//CDS//3329536330//2262//frame0